MRQLLTQQEVDVYVIQRSVNDVRSYAAMVKPLGRDTWWDRPITFVGSERFHTHVYEGDE